MTRVLVVDDSALMRRLLGEVLSANGFQVSFARDGLEALDAIAADPPDVVTMDVQMPRMDGLAALDRIMLEHPVPVVMLSSLTGAGTEATLEALRLGAVDFLPKPAGAASLSMNELTPVLLEKLRAATGARLRRSHRLAERVRLRAGLPAGPGPARFDAPGPVQSDALRPARSSAPGPAQPSAPAAEPARPALRGDPPGIVLVGCSTGGPPALDALLAPLPADFPWPILIAQHMPAGFTGALARRLDRLCALTVEEVLRPVRLLPGHAYVGRGDADLILGRRPAGLVAMAAPADPLHRWHPSANRMVESAMALLPAARLIGVLMTGMGDDGAATMARLRAAGGRTIAEAEETAVVWGMPGALVRAGGAGAVLPLGGIAGALRRWLA
ncbi:chemotaxis-specific protein-glutamate methyltransferase CheB [Roseomonas populi]|uniref:Protein-glutamate methylesterase/protein-glutamine glutaminase n=1 Tax=Roseomonas populi TaxID=3121582 RepID=A0ABT1X065_9PROT|nr:chemotaxis-specific protein-glutamate methyltransferase CheB [Roseomonas pecuniae]MCR0981493.1 chemotaxis-specific protein-glutamate methyltransferase CheB [Roseomonas pecuniae]